MFKGQSLSYPGRFVTQLFLLKVRDVGVLVALPGTDREGAVEVRRE